MGVADDRRNNLLITKKIDALKALGDTPFKWFNGNVTTTLHSLKAGGDGTRTGRLVSDPTPARPPIRLTRDRKSVV